ncbi:ATP-dependent helicase [Kibdelosporangium aridum]|uniref:ATP-dependent helicase n=1 Tax=Kibdelosporangium aridum TaxID=2030 RepID=A0A428Z277_KIBAR|nr:DEAD/DEAH box helicase [Kibdelosporangium aridum]RSM79387.1 ATP-dependent helicase [Kibdelosporangium aridum]
MSGDELTGLLALHPVIQHHLVNTLRWPGLRALQAAAVGPVTDGVDCLLLAPTAGGKTEAALFPLLTRMATEDWRGTSVLYVCPLKALLNDLAGRLTDYTGWLGRSSAVWHGDVGQTARQRIRQERPDVLLTTPESLEAMLVSSTVDHRRVFADLRAVVVDEIHAFAGDDRGWHLLAVLERLSRVAGRPLQRIGLSATVGNPPQLLRWLQGSFHDRERQVIAPIAVAAEPPEITVDHVGSIDNAAKVISLLHQGEKRLVFVDSRRRAEELGAALTAKGVTTFLSHSSLSAAERRRAEEAFANERDCVIVATSTLELGIDVGDLDRVIQLDAPRTVASFLQRLGRTGRRNGYRNCLFLCLDTDAVAHACGLLLRWSQGWVEPVEAPPAPRHIMAQQILALALQEGVVGTRSWREWWGDLPMFDDTGPEIVRYLVAEGYLEPDGDLAVIGSEAERRFGHRYFSDLTAVFSAPPQFLVLAGRTEIGLVGDDVLIADTFDGSRVLLLAGRSWLVTSIDWQRRRCQVEPTDLLGRAKWSGRGGGVSFELARGIRDVLGGADPKGVILTRRAVTAIGELRSVHGPNITVDATVIRQSESETRWWTWAGIAANRCLAVSLPGLVDQQQRIGDRSLRLRSGVTVKDVQTALNERVRLRLPPVDRNALSGLKFSAALPPGLAERTVAERLADLSSASKVLMGKRVFIRST